MNQQAEVPMLGDGPWTPNFTAIPLEGNVSFDTLPGAVLSQEILKAVAHAPRGTGAAWGLPFTVDLPILIHEVAVAATIPETRAEWLVFMHTSDRRPLPKNEDGFISPMTGEGHLAELAANYVILYADGTEVTVPIYRRHQLGAFQRRWGENCFQAVAHKKPQPVRAAHEQTQAGWGQTQTRVRMPDSGAWVNWLWAWKNPHPDRVIVGVRFEPVSGAVLISGLSAGSASAQPLRWRRRQKALLSLPEDVTGDPATCDPVTFDPELDDHGLLRQIQLDMGQVISAETRLQYPDATWEETYNNKLPEKVEREVMLAYTAHPDAHVHLATGEIVPLRAVEEEGTDATASAYDLTPIPPAHHRVTLRVVEHESRTPVAVKLHVHGAAGEYLSPVDRHRIVNPAWFEDYSVDFAHRGTHACTYIPGETEIDLPLGRVYVEVSKGFEIRPIRKVVEVDGETETITLEVERVLPWRRKGWVSADTHVHFLSPMSAQLEGAGEGVNVVNLLASQWGELMTNVGDFDGRNTWGSKETGGDGEYLVRVGTENRQHVLGHISLLGYEGRIIAPMTTGGPDESAMGDPIEVLLTEWARQCRKQGGLVVLPHFPNPRAEHAASIISGDVDALEMTSWGDLYSGISPYSLSDWYRYLNCGYMVAAVGGTDKMSAETAVGTVRTYAKIPDGAPFTYQGWMDAVRRAETFVTYGPLLEFTVDGHPMGSRIGMSGNGGTVDVEWEAASVTVPMSRVDLVVNGEIRESVAVDPDHAAGQASVAVDESAWLAVLVRGHYPDKPEIIAAHSSPVMIDVEGSQMLAAADAVTILEQIEGALAYLDTVGTRADDRAYKRMRLVLESAHRGLHNRMHKRGYYHDHTPVTDHPEHHA
jgi:hypothetical protein